jgi:hypothetical protein
MTAKAERADEDELREIAQFWVRGFDAKTGGDAAKLARGYLDLRVREAELENQNTDLRAVAKAAREVYELVFGDPEKAGDFAAEDLRAALDRLEEMSDE